MAKAKPETTAASDVTTPNEKTDLPGPHPKSYSVPSGLNANGGRKSTTAPTMAMKSDVLYHVLEAEMAIGDDRTWMGMLRSCSVLPVFIIRNLKMPAFLTPRK